jgi:hypothetical protein
MPPVARSIRALFLAVLVGCLSASVSLQSAAAPFALQVGDVRMGFDLPPGFADTGFTGSPRLQELSESLTSASNRVIVFALTDADLRRFTGGDTPELRQYLLAVTPRALEHQRVTPSEFDAYVREGLRSLGTAPAGDDFQKVLEARPHGELALLAELRREPEAVAVLRGVRVPPPDSGFFSFAKPSSYVLSTTSLVLLRGKALTLTVVTGYESKADVEWIRFTTLRWIDELRRLNASR